MGVTVLVPLLSKVTRHIAIDNGLGHCHSLQREGKGESGGEEGWDEMERITVFSDDGALVSSLPCASVRFGLAVDPKGDLLVACFDGKCVQIF